MESYNSHHSQRNYYSGLELVPQTDPEVVPASAPEVVWPHAEKDQPCNDSTLMEPTATEQPWYLKRTLLVGVAIAAALIIVGVVTGCVVGLRHKRNSSADRSNSTYKTACTGDVCPQILTAATVGSPPSLYVFARGIDNSIWYTSTETSSLDFKAWQKLDGEVFLSQPVAAGWDGSSALTVAAVTDTLRTVHQRTFNWTTSQWDDSWEDLGGSPTSAVTMCIVDFERLDLWTIDDNEVIHDLFNFTQDSFTSVTRDDHSWPGISSFSSGLSGRPAVVCRNDSFYHDIYVYSSNGSVQYTSYSESTGWARPYAPIPDVEFRGDPVLLGTTVERLDFFGIDTKGAMMHFNWQEMTGLSSSESLGGSFESVPSAVATRNGSRIDVVALGTNGTLLHRVWQDSNWSSSWEDLGVIGNSAPLLLNLTGHGQPERVVAFVIGSNGEINQTTWTVSNDVSWQGLSWASLGGNMTHMYYSD